MNIFTNPADTIDNMNNGSKNENETPLRPRISKNLENFVRQLIYRKLMQKIKSNCRESKCQLQNICLNY